MSFRLAIAAGGFLFHYGEAAVADVPMVQFQWLDYTCTTGAGVASDARNSIAWTKKILDFNSGTSGVVASANYEKPASTAITGVAKSLLHCDTTKTAVLFPTADKALHLSADLEMVGGTGTPSDVPVGSNAYWSAGTQINVLSTDAFDNMSGNCADSYHGAGTISGSQTTFGPTSLAHVVRLGLGMTGTPEAASHVGASLSGYVVDEDGNRYIDAGPYVASATKVKFAKMEFNTNIATLQLYCPEGANGSTGCTASEFSLQAVVSSNGDGDEHLDGRLYHSICGVETVANKHGMRIVATAGLLMYRPMIVAGTNAAGSVNNVMTSAKFDTTVAGFPGTTSALTRAAEYACATGAWLYFKVKVGTGTNLKKLDASLGTMGAPNAAAGQLAGGGTGTESVCYRLHKVITDTGYAPAVGTSGIMTCNSPEVDVTNVAVDNVDVHMSFTDRAKVAQFLLWIGQTTLAGWQQDGASGLGFGTGSKFYEDSVRVEPVWTYDCHATLGETALTAPSPLASATDLSTGDALPLYSSVKGHANWDKLGYLKFTVARPSTTENGGTAISAYTASAGMMHASKTEFDLAVTVTSNTSACTALLNADGMLYDAKEGSRFTGDFAFCKSTGANPATVELWYVPAYAATSGTTSFLGTAHPVTPKIVDHLSELRAVFRHASDTKSELTASQKGPSKNWTYKLTPVEFILPGKRTSDDPIPFVTYKVGGQKTGSPASSADLADYTLVSAGFAGFVDINATSANTHSSTNDLCMALAALDTDQAVACSATTATSATLYYIPLLTDETTTGTGVSYSDATVFGPYGGTEDGTGITTALQKIFKQRPTNIHSLVEDKVLYTPTATDYHWVTFDTTGLFSPFTTSGQSSATVATNFYVKNSACRALINAATAGRTDAQVAAALTSRPFQYVIACQSDAKTVSLAFLNQRIRDLGLAQLATVGTAANGDLFGLTTNKDKWKMAPKPISYASRGQALTAATSVQIFKVTVGQKESSGTKTAWEANATDSTKSTGSIQGAFHVTNSPCKYWADIGSAHDGSWCGYAGGVISVHYVGVPETEAFCGNLIFTAGVGKPGTAACDPYHGQQTSGAISNPQLSRLGQLRAAMNHAPVAATWPVPFSIADADNPLVRVKASFYHGSTATSTTLDTAATTGSTGITDTVCNALDTADTTNSILACKQTGTTPGDASQATLFFGSEMHAVQGLRALAATAATAAGVSHIKPKKVQCVKPMSAWTGSTVAFKDEMDVFKVEMTTKAEKDSTADKWTDMTNWLNSAGSACEIVDADWTSITAPRPLPAKTSYPIFCSHPKSCHTCTVETLFIGEDPFKATDDGLRDAWQAFLQAEQYDDAATPAVEQQKFKLKENMLYEAQLTATISYTTTPAATRRSLITIPVAGLATARGKSETDSLCALLGSGANVLACESDASSVTARFASSADRQSVLQSWGKVERKPASGGNGLGDLVPKKLVDHGGTESKMIKLCLQGKGPLVSAVATWTKESTGLQAAGSACGVFASSNAIHCVAKQCSGASKKRELQTVSGTQEIELLFARDASVTDETNSVYTGFQGALSSSKTYEFSMLKVDGAAALALEYETSLPLYSSTTHAPMVASSCGALNGVTASTCKMMGHSRITKALTCVNTAATAAAAGTTTFGFATHKDACAGAREMHATAVNGVSMALKKYAGVAPVKSDLSFTAVKKITKSTTRKYDQAGICAALAALKGDSLPVATFVECHVAAEVAKDATGKLELVYLTADDAAKAAKAWLDKGKTEATVLAFAKDATLSGALTTTSSVAGGGGNGSSTTSAKPTGTNTTASIRVLGLALAVWCSVLVFA